MKRLFLSARAQTNNCESVKQPTEAVEEYESGYQPRGLAEAAASQR